MSKAPISEVVNNVFRDTVENWKKEGLSDERIIEKIEKVNFEDVMFSIADTASSDYTTFFRDKMYEIELDERAKSKEFSAHQEQLWGKCFAASQTMYVLAVEAADNYCKYIDKNASAEEKEQHKFTFLALHHIHGRACQVFLEVLYLLRLGFADCAYSRWRCLYELNCVAYFIKSQGEQIAKQFYEQSQTENQFYLWTKGAVDDKGRKLSINSFGDLEKYCNMGEIWHEQYKLACKVTHGSPQGTFKRMAIRETRDQIPVGQSDCGIAVPAEHSAISLHLISALFFTMFPYVDGVVYVKTLGKWVEVIQDMYYSTEKEVFPKKQQ